jgi:hypothetical protein
VLHRRFGKVLSNIGVKSLTLQLFTQSARIGYRIRQRRVRTRISGISNQ